MPNQSTPIKQITDKEIESILLEAKPAIDFGVRMPSNVPSKPRELTTEECQAMFGVSQSVKMNFIPQMLTAVALQQVTKLVNYCRDNRLGVMKKHTRVLKMAVEEYAERLAEAYGPDAFRAYGYYVERYQRECAVDIWKMEIHADALCRNQLPGNKHREIAWRTLIVLMLIAFVNKYDSEVNKMISAKAGVPCRQKKDVYQEAIRSMCISIGEDLGYKINPDKEAGEWVQVLSNKAWHLADSIIGEEAEP